MAVGYWTPCSSQRESQLCCKTRTLRYPAINSNTTPPRQRQDSDRSVHQTVSELARTSNGKAFVPHSQRRPESSLEFPQPNHAPTFLIRDFEFGSQKEAAAAAKVVSTWNRGQLCLLVCRRSRIS